jgi:hypothetical protein
MVFPFGCLLLFSKRCISRCIIGFNKFSIGLFDKYKLRAPFIADYNDVTGFLENNIKNNTDYKLMLFDEIYNDIISKYC